MARPASRCAVTGHRCGDRPDFKTSVYELDLFGWTINAYDGPADIVLLVVAGLPANAVNAVAGGGSLISFSALLDAGMSGGPTATGEHDWSIPVGEPRAYTGAIRDEEEQFDAVKRRFPSLADAIAEARREQIVFLELDTRQDAGYTVSLEWDRHTGDTQIVVADNQTASLLVFPVPGENASDAFRHPFRYAP